MLSERDPAIMSTKYWEYGMVSFFEPQFALTYLPIEPYLLGGQRGPVNAENGVDKLVGA